MPIVYRHGDATLPISAGPRCLTHIVNSVGGWGRGFVLAVSKRWPQPEQAYRQWYAQRLWEGVLFELGAVQFVKVAPDLHVVNMIAQAGYGTNNRNQHRTDERDATPPIRYEAIEQCLTEVAKWAKPREATVHMPRIGCGLAGGKWELIEPIIEQTLPGLRVFVYDP